MSVPVTTKHKCSLFESEIPAITYNSGGTYTLGALLEVRVVNENIFFIFKLLKFFLVFCLLKPV